MTTATATRTAGPDTSARELTGEVLTTRVLRGDFRSVTLRDRSELVGELTAEEASRIVGLACQFFGQWRQHARYGWQFNFESVVVAAKQPTTGIVNYLSRSNLGITRTVANKIVKHFGEAAIDTLRDSPAAVVNAQLLDLDVAMAAAARLQQLAQFEKPRIELFQLFAGHGLTKKTVDGCLEAWGRNAPDVVRRDPFRMLVKRLDGVGFQRADSLYQALNLPLHRLKRQLMAGWHALLTDGDGNTWETRQKINKAILDAVGMAEFRGERAVRLGLRARWLRERDGWLAAAERAADEERAVAHLQRLMKGKAAWPTVPQGEMIDSQFAGVTNILQSKVGVLAGTPGTGKTFCAAAILREVLRSTPVDLIGVCAPTGKAAVRITAAMQRYELPLTATTIHRLLMGGPSGDFQFNETNQLSLRVLVCDETSMNDTGIMAALFAALPSWCHVLLVGDPFQLSPVGHGAPLRDFIAAGVPTALLTEIKRNAGLIVEACRDIKDGRPFTDTPAKFSDAPAENLRLMHVAEPADQVGALLAILGSCPARGIDPIWETQVIVARNDDTPVSRKVLNPVLQNLLNPKRDGVPAERQNEKYRVGDKFICLRNQRLTGVMLRAGSDPADVEAYEKTTGAPCDAGGEEATPSQAYVANGDQGRVVATSPGKIVVEFHAPRRLVVIDDKPADNKDYDLAYAITCHKGQGSEWPFVIYLVDKNGWGVHCREHIYTGLSRASKLCLVLGDRATCMRMILKVNLGKRKTFLKEMIEAGRSASPPDVPAEASEIPRAAQDSAAPPAASLDPAACDRMAPTLWRPPGRSCRPTTCDQGQGQGQGR
jgi:exodeoxyribonuclease V alpha subunit